MLPIGLRAHASRLASSSLIDSLSSEDGHEGSNDASEDRGAEASGTTSTVTADHALATDRLSTVQNPRPSLGLVRASALAVSGRLRPGLDWTKGCITGRDHIA